MAGRTASLDLRVALPVVALGIVVLVIIFVELCGREDLPPLVTLTPPPALPTATIGPTFTPGPSPTIDPAEATATQEVLVGDETRDAIRLEDLAEIGLALTAYREENGSFPDTGGNIQTLCAFRDSDAGCELEDLLSPLPEDPLGEPGRNGYWYASTGLAFTLYAQRESDASPPCEQHPQHLQEFDSLLCIEGP